MPAENKALSPGSTQLSIKTEKASIPGSVQTSMSIKTERAPSVMTEKVSVRRTGKGQKIKSSTFTSKRPTKAGALPPKPTTVKDFARNKSTKKASVPSSLGIPDLSKSEKQTVRSESPATPNISNARAVIGQNLSFTFPPEDKRISSVRSMSPSLEKSAASSKNTGSATTNEEVEDNECEEWRDIDPPLDNIGSAIVITDLLSATQGLGSSVEETEMKKETNAPTDGAYVKTTIDGDGQEVIMSPSMEKKDKNTPKGRPKTTLLQKAFSFSSRNSKQSVDEVQVMAPSASKDSSKSSKNPASDASTAASTVSGSSGSISSNENKSQGNFSEAATECTMKASNATSKPIGKSMSFSGPQKDRASIKTVRSMSPSLNLRNKYLSSIRAGQKKDERETIASAAVKDKSLPPLPPKQRPVAVTSKLETTDSKSEADNSSVEVVGVVEGATATCDCDKSNSSDSDTKRRQKIKMGKLLRSRHDIKSKQSSSPSQSASVISSKSGEIPPLDSVASDKHSVQASTIQKEYTNALGKSGSSGSSEVKSLSEFIAVAQGPAPSITEKSASNEMDVYADLKDPVPIGLIDFVADPNHDDTITLDPDLSNEKPKYHIWHENEDIYKPTPKHGRYSCGAGHFGNDNDDSIVSGDFLDDDLSDDGRGNRRQPLACGADDLAEEIGIEMKAAASDVYKGVKKVSMSAARVLFGACDITADGGVDYLAKEMNATQHQLLTGEIPEKKTTIEERAPRRDKGIPTAEEALEEATQKHVQQRKSAYLNKRYQNVTIVDRQEQARMQREEEGILKKKRHVQRLKLLSMKHL